MIRNKLIWASFALSTVLHLVFIYLFGEFRHQEIEAEEFRVRLAYQRESLKPRRLSTTPISAPDAASTQMEYLPAGGEPAESDDAIEAAEPEAITVAPVDPSLSPARLDPGAKSEAPIFARERMVSPHEMGLVDSLIDLPMGLLRWADLARANREHAAVVPNVASPRDIEGFINFTRIRVQGAGSDTAGSLDALARYIRDNSGILAQVREGWYEYFRSEQLLKDPIHFMVEGHGLRLSSPDQLTRFGDDELALLRVYLDSGGFLYIEGSPEPPQRFLREMIGHLQVVLGDEGGIFELPPDHPIYFSFFSFDLGFPGEDKSHVRDWGQTGWHYPRSRMRKQGTQTTQGVAEPIGLYGISYRGELVGVISDLGMAERWSDRIQEQEETSRNASIMEPPPPIDHLGALQSATNIVVYALTRPGSLTASFAKPVWSTERPDWLPGQYADTDASEPHRAEYEADEIFSELDAYMALLHSPLGQLTADAELTVRIDGAYSLSLLKGGFHGLMLHNLPPGEHWIELTYGGKSKQLEFNLIGGQVTTATFSLNRFAFLTQLRLRLMREVVGPPQWWESFDDLEMEEVYLGSDSEVLNAATPAMGDRP